MSASGLEPRAVVEVLLPRRAGGRVPAAAVVVLRAVGPVVPIVSMATLGFDSVMEAEILTTPGSWGVDGAEVSSGEAGPWRWGGRGMVFEMRMRGLWVTRIKVNKKHVMWHAKITPCDMIQEATWR